MAAPKRVYPLGRDEGPFSWTDSSISEDTNSENGKLVMTRLDIKKIPGARKAPMPKFVSPQLATLVNEPPSGEKWLHELKFDGYRMICHIDRGKVQIWSRNEKDWTEKFPGVAEAVKSLPVTSAILDGEIVVVDAEGRASFQKLQRSMGKSVTSGLSDKLRHYLS